MKVIDDQVRRIVDAYWDNEVEAAKRHHVVLVEGDDDRAILEMILSGIRRSWETRVRVVVAGGRENVLSRMQGTFPNALALVDRDTWTDEEIEVLRKERPSLHVTRGWCIENLFFDRKLLERYGDSVVAILDRERERWVRAGALWWCLQRRREAMQAWQSALRWTYGQPRDDLKLTSGSDLADSFARLVSEDLRRGAGLDLGAIVDDFERRVDEVLRLPEDEQWSVGVHGKEAFNQVLVPALVAARTRSAAQGQRLDWRVELARDLDRPSSLGELLALLLP